MKKKPSGPLVLLLVWLLALVIIFIISPSGGIDGGEGLDYKMGWFLIFGFCYTIFHIIFSIIAIIVSGLTRSKVDK